MALTGSQRQRRYYRRHIRKSRPKMGRPINDLRWKTFGRLTVVEMDTAAPRGANIAIRWIVRCECGKEKSVSGRDLVQGKQRSCGCQKGRGDRRVPTHWRQLLDNRVSA